MTTPPAIVAAVPLAPLTTLELGGPARHFVEATDEATVAAVVAWATGRGLPLFVLGGGSNVVVADAGFDGVVLRMGLRGRRFESEGDRVLAHVAAGESWDAFVNDAVGRGLAGIECLAGIPGLVGATPIQNVGAYGQDVSETIRSVRALSRGTGQIVDLTSADCEFGYRDSMFKRRPDAYVVLGVTFALAPGGVPVVRYRELEDALAERTAPGVPRGLEVSQMVRTLRRKKSMVIDVDDPNRRSVGSFFTNPVLSSTDAANVVARVISSGAARVSSDVPQFPAAGGQVKLSAGWLVERAGFPKGFRRGAVGVSSNHALALVHHGGGTSTELAALARDIRDAVAIRFGVTLVPEPIAVGMSWGAE